MVINCRDNWLALVSMGTILQWQENQAIRNSGYIGEKLIYHTKKALSTLGKLINCARGFWFIYLSPMGTLWHQFQHFGPLTKWWRGAKWEYLSTFTAELCFFFFFSFDLIISAVFVVVTSKASVACKGVVYW